MLQTLVSLVFMLCLGALRALASSGDPFEFGIIPPDNPSGPVTSCENRVNKAAGKLIAALLRCEAKRAKGSFADDTAMDAGCKQPAIARFLRTNVSGCTPCVDLTGISNAVASGLIYGGGLALEGSIYCAASSAPCTRPNTSCTCSGGLFPGGQGWCLPDLDGVNLYCVAFGGCSATACSQDTDCPLQLGEPTVCVWALSDETTPPDWRCCYARCD